MMCPARRLARYIGHPRAALLLLFTLHLGSLRRPECRRAHSFTELASVQSCVLCAPTFVSCAASLNTELLPPPSCVTCGVGDTRLAPPQRWHPRPPHTQASLQRAATAVRHCKGCNDSPLEAKTRALRSDQSQSPLSKIPHPQAPMLELAQAQCQTAKRAREAR